MTVLRARALDSQGKPVAGRTAVLEPWTGNRYRSSYSGPSAVRGLTATSGSDGWMSWTLPNLLRRPGPRGALWMVTGLEAQPIVLATQPTDTTTTGTRVGTVSPLGDLVPTPVVPVDTAAQATAAAQAAVSTVTAGAPTSLDTLAEVAAELQGRLSDTALRAAFGRGIWSSTSLTDLLQTATDDAPTVGAFTAATASPVSAIASAKTVGSILNQTTINPVFRFYGAPTRVKGNTFPNYNYVSHIPQQYTNAAPPWSAAFITDAPALELRIQAGLSGSYRVRVDGKIVGDYFHPAGSGMTLHPFTWAARKSRHIEIEGTSWAFAGVNVSMVDTVMPWRGSVGPRVFWTGDSFPEGGSTDRLKYASFPHYASRALGWLDVVNVAVGATGYLTNGSGTSGKATVRNRIPVDITPYLTGSRDIVFFHAGYNDNDGNGYTATALTAEAALTWQTMAAAAPKALLIAIGPCPMSTTAAASPMGRARDALYAAWQANKGIVPLWIDPLAGRWETADGRTGGTGQQWVTGTGRVGATTGDGPADIARWSDATHPSAVGDVIIRVNVINAIREAFPIPAPVVP